MIANRQGQALTGFVYLWYDRKRKWFCVGSHMGTLTDGYTSSTGFFHRAYTKRPEDFKRRIIHYHYDDTKSLRQKEQYFLDMIKQRELHPIRARDHEIATSVRYYNMKKNAEGLDPVTASISKTEWYKTEAGLAKREQLRNLFKSNNPSIPGKAPWNKGISAPSISAALLANPRHIDEEERQRMGIKFKKMWEEGVYDNRPKPTQEKIERCRASRIANGKGTSDLQKQRASEIHKGKIVSSETREKMAEAAAARPPVTCPYCGHTGKGPQMYRYHFSNCKHR